MGRAFVVGIATAGLLTAPSWTRAEGDIGLVISGGQLVTTKISEGGDPLGPDRVFSASFSSIGGAWYTDEPGLQIGAGTLSPGSNLGMFFTRALRQWNGANFDLVSGGRVSSTFGPPSNSIWTPLTDVNTGSMLFPVESSGGLHDHPDWVLENFDPGADPFYFLAEARFTSDQGGLADSLPFYIVFGVNADESDLEAMEGWVRENIIPSPASLALFGLVAWGRTRRSRAMSVR
ncbi:MAG: hypothetical protein JNM86_11060 [Phycisphaerae bacterium]|nr:hypothetical protein [Phycisphaerae bacterium]